MKIADFASPYSPLFSSLGFLLLLKLLSFPGFNSFVCCPASKTLPRRDDLDKKPYLSSPSSHHLCNHKTTIGESRTKGKGSNKKKKKLQRAERGNTIEREENKREKKAEARRRSLVTYGT
jgi:hypothetical protein